MPGFEGFTYQDNLIISCPYFGMEGRKEKILSLDSFIAGGVKA